MDSDFRFAVLICLTILAVIGGLLFTLDRENDRNHEKGKFKIDPNEFTITCNVQRSGDVVCVNDN